LTTQSSDGFFGAPIYMTRQLVIGQLNNWLSSVSTYSDMSPDVTIRRQVNQQLTALARRSMGFSHWCQLFCSNPRSDTARARRVLAFVYEHFADYTGLDFSRVRPSDRLIADLQFPLVCWFDWSLTFCEDFYQAFDVDLSDRFDEADFETMGDLVSYLLTEVAFVEVSPREMAMAGAR
jgi:hypothetical protein